MDILIYLIDLCFKFCYFVIILQVAMSWLVAFDVINLQNPQAKNLARLIHKLTDPVYSRLRKFIPPIGGIDLTPLVVMIALSILRSVLIGFLAQI